MAPTFNNTVNKIVDVNGNAFMCRAASKMEPPLRGKPPIPKGADNPGVAIMKGLSQMKMLKIGAALLAMGAPIAAYGSTARNIVLVPGAFTDKSSWDKVAHLLRAKGFKVAEVDIPLTSLESDVAATRKVLDAQKGATVLVGHSWGGVVIGEAGDSPKVKSLVYVAAFAPDKGESVQALSSNGPQTEGLKAVSPDARGFLSVDRAAFPHVFVGDVPESEGAELAKKQRPVSGAAFDAKATVAAWHLKPTYYAISANDLMVPPQAEAFFAQRMKATTVTLQSSHASPVSHPREVAALIEQAAKGE